MLTIHDLLEDSRYKEFFLRVPKLPAVATAPGTTPPWRLYVQTKDHKWKRRDFQTYADAFKFLKRMLKSGKVHDAAITCKRMGFAPPTRMVRIKGKYVWGSDGVKRQATKRVEWKPVIPPDEFDDHRWCPYCRRPTAFGFFSSHHALSGIAIDPSVRRCFICGSSERITQYRRPQ